MKHSLIPAVDKPTEGKFNGHPVLTFPNPDNPKEPGIQMGTKKLRAVLPYVKEAQDFVERHKPKTPTTATEKQVSAMAELLRKLGVKEEEIQAHLSQ